MTENRIGKPGFCFDCVHWISQIGELTQEQRVLVVKLLEANLGLLGIRPELIDRAVTSGECDASYTNKEGGEFLYKITTLGATACSATDDLGNHLYGPVPKGR